MLGLVAAGVAGAGDFQSAARPELLEGAIAGAFFVGAAFLTGCALIRRSGMALGALVLVIAAGALQLTSLGLFGATGAGVFVLLQGLFAAAVIVFLSSSIHIARYNAFLGGLMFTAALVIAGLGIINLVGRVEVAGLMRYAVMGVGAFSLLLAGSQAVRGDNGAQMVLPGVVLVTASALMALFLTEGTTALAAAPNGLFTLGVLTASLVALTDGGVHRMPAGVGLSGHETVSSDFGGSGDARERSEIVIDSQIARVLDYAGVATWDWCDGAVKQTNSLAKIFGGEAGGVLSADALREFVHKDDLQKFESEVGAAKDGPFDVAVRLNDGRKLRMRGARAINTSTEELERVVAFVETVDKETAPAGAGNGVAKLDGNNGVSENGVRKATEAAVIPTAAVMATGAKLTEALENGDITAAFQPIVSLASQKVAGYETLARWPGQENVGNEEGPASFVRTAEAVGKGGVLSQIMLDAAAAFLAEKIKTEKRKDLFVTLNVSFGQMQEAGFVAAVRNAIDSHKLPDKALVLELTEADAVSDAAAAGKIFRSLTSAGAGLAFDDFGAGFSCLSNLHKFDFDYLKIDQSFIADLEKGGDKSKIVRALAMLGKDLGMEVIAEGVETKDVAGAAHDIGCAYAQGFLFGEPIASAAGGEPKASAPQMAAKQETDDAPVSEADLDGDNVCAIETADDDKLEKENKAEKKEGGWRPWRPGLR